MFWYNNPKWTNISLFILKASLQKKDGFIWGTVNVTKLNILGISISISPLSFLFFYPPGLTTHSFSFSHWFKQIWYFLNFIKYVHWFLHTSLLCLFCCTVKTRWKKQTDKLTNKQKTLAFSLEPPKRWKSLAWRAWPGIIYLDPWEDLMTTHSCHFVRIVVILQSFASFPGPRQRRDGLTVKCEKMPLKKYSVKTV